MSESQSPPSTVWDGRLSHQLWRVRTDEWHRLRDAARRLGRGGNDDEQMERLRGTCRHAFTLLLPLERAFAFPGHRAVSQLHSLFEQDDMEAFSHQAIRLVRLLTTGTYRQLDLLNLRIRDYADVLRIEEFSDEFHKKLQHETRPYFETLVVDDLPPRDESELQMAFRRMRRTEDPFIYEVVVARTFEEALQAVLANATIQSCVLRYSFPFRTGDHNPVLESTYPLLDLDRDAVEGAMPGVRTLMLGNAIHALRPELDIFLVSDAPVEDVVGPSSAIFQRVFYHAEDYHDIHLSVLKRVDARYATPFFSALRKYAVKPTGVFHALPIARGKSISKSAWIKDLEGFYGSRAFEAESSATTGGLDSLLQPVGTIKEAQQAAARAFGAPHSYFVTNGTSTANKIVMQALMQPGDIVLLSHDCHKSHPYAVILAGAQPVYLEAYPLSEFSMYGGVPLEEIKRQLLHLRQAGKLDRVKLLLLTNITFDGITYQPERVMEEVLAIKPNIVFLWDEAWFAYGRFSPTLRRRTAMECANRLRARLASPEYARTYAEWRERFDGTAKDDDAWIHERLLPDPAAARVRVYATHSTHKTLTALRQGSMIHVNDDDFELGRREIFNEAYMTHTSTSPNYQILGSLDVGRRQVELEGFDFVQRAIQMAMMLRERVRSDPLLQRYFRVLGPADMIPAPHRPSGLDVFFHPDRGWRALEGAWLSDEFVLDPTRVTIHVGRTGLDGDQFKKMLMDRFDIQINKTSRNTVLFMVHIGVQRGMIAHLVKVLTTISQELEERRARSNPIERERAEQRVRALVEELPPLPHFSRFHRAFLPTPDSTTREGDMRAAFYHAYDQSACEYLHLGGNVSRELARGREVVSASFVTPYPPGFPILMPGQVITEDILAYLNALDVKEIHGYDPRYGLRVFRDDALTEILEARTTRLEERAPA